MKYKTKEIIYREKGVGYRLINKPAFLFLKNIM